MRVERYYSSVREELSPLSEDATTLLYRQDYVGFFKACGPSYIRSIRRAQEVTAIFTFESSSVEYARQFANGLRTVGWGKSASSTDSFHSQSKYDGIVNSLKIEIKGYGLGLNVEGSSTLYASSLSEFHDVMEFAFKSMTQADHARHIGMVYGLELVPWVDNPAFQVASRLVDEELMLPLPKSLIPRARKKKSPTPAPGSTASPSPSTVDRMECKSPFYEKDKYNYCCEPPALFNPSTQRYDFQEEIDDSANYMCRPVRQLAPALMKENMASNGEFVSRIDSALRLKLAKLANLEKCVSAARSINERFDTFVLKSKDTVEYNPEIENKVTLAELKMAMDPLNNFGMIRHLAREIDEYVDMFYTPCLAALFGANVGTSSEVEAKYFMAYAWHTHDECSHIECLIENMRWDRDSGGCMPSLITGASSGDYSGSNEMCSYELDDYGEEESCKYPTDLLQEFYDEANTCWNELPNFSISYYMEHFCLPQVSGTNSTEERATEIKNIKDNYCSGHTDTDSPAY